MTFRKVFSKEEIAEFEDFLSESELVTQVPEKVIRDGLSIGKNIIGSINDSFRSFEIHTEEYKYIIRGRATESHKLPSNKPISVNTLFYVGKQENLNEKYLDLTDGWVVQNPAHKKTKVIPEVKTAAHKGQRLKHEYVFQDESTQAELLSKKIERPEEKIVLENMESQGSWPTIYKGTTNKGKKFYLKGRSGSITLWVGNKEEVNYSEDEVVFSAFIGKEFPGLFNSHKEVLNMVNSMNYIKIPEKYLNN